MNQKEILKRLEKRSGRMRTMARVFFFAAGVFSGFVLREELSYSTGIDQYDDIINEHNKNSATLLRTNKKPKMIPFNDAIINKPK